MTYGIVLRSGQWVKIVWQGDIDSLWQELSKPESRFALATTQPGQEFVSFRLGKTAEERIDYISESGLENRRQTLEVA